MEEEVVPEAANEDAVKAVIVKRMEGVRNRDPNLIPSVVHRDLYSKFDDWPPFTRQTLDGLEREVDALKVLKEYDYSIDDWRIEVFGDAAIASFIMKYDGLIRSMKFNICSRISVFLVKRKGNWMIVHEH